MVNGEPKGTELYRVQPEQRNRLVDQGGDRAPHRQRVGPADVRGHVTDGPFLLSWMGVWREEPFRPEEEALFARLIGPLQARLCVERELWAGRPSALGALGEVLELLGTPAFVFTPKGALALANAAGRAILETDSTIVADCAAAIRDGAGPRVKSDAAVVGRIPDPLGGADPTRRSLAPRRARRRDEEADRRRDQRPRARRPGRSEQGYRKRAPAPLRGPSRCTWRRS